MRLELASFTVTNVRRGAQTRYQNGTLEINIDELSALVLSDPKIARADLDIAFPGEKTRIVRVRDAVEPRIKVAGPGAVFPGILGPVETVGEGRTHRLAGLTVIASAEYERTILEGTAAGRTGLVDMWGLGGRADAVRLDDQYRPQDRAARRYFRIGSPYGDSTSGIEARARVGRDDPGVDG